MSRIIRVEMRVWISRTVASEPFPRADLMGSSKRPANAIPYMTRAILFPTSMVAIYLEGCLRKYETIPERNFCCLRSISIRNLLDETKAISIPEKKAEKTMEIRMRIISANIFFLGSSDAHVSS